MPRPRSRALITVRRLMVAVAIVGVLVGGGVEGERRHWRFSWQSDLHTLKWIAGQPGRPERGAGTGRDAGWKGSHERLKARAEFHLRMADKYAWASRYPWLPILPDPPEPE